MLSFRSLCLGLFSALLLATSATAANVGVSVSINQPGFYGRVDVGHQPPPVYYPQPIIIQPTPVAVYQRPIYLRVPPGHERNWGKHCHRYNACGQPVYFVKDRDHHPHAKGHQGKHRHQAHRGHDDRRGPSHKQGGRHGHDRHHGHGGHGGHGHR